MLDMGCHSVAFCRWVLGNKAIKQVSATMGTSARLSGPKSAAKAGSLRTASVSVTMLSRVRCGRPAPRMVI